MRAAGRGSMPEFGRRCGCGWEGTALPTGAYDMIRQELAFLRFP